MGDASNERIRRFEKDDPAFLEYQKAVLAAYRADRAKRRSRVETFEAEADEARARLNGVVRKTIRANGLPAGRKR